MSEFEIFAMAGLVSILLVCGYIAFTNTKVGSPLVAAALSAGFGAYSVVTVANEGAEVLWTNHTGNLWGVQVWWDLLFAVGIALFFIAPRARKVGMNVPLWTLFILATASIALLAMIARLFWLEKQSETAAV